MSQDLHNINHDERPICHVASVSRGRRKLSTARTRLGKTLIEGVGNYLIVSHPQLGNSLSVSITVTAQVSEAIDVVRIASSEDLALIGSSFDAKVRVGEWTVMGNTTPRPGLPRPACKEVVGTPDRIDVVDFSGSKRRIATSEEIRLLPFRSIVAPVRLENALKALHGLAEWHDEYDRLVPANVVPSARVFV